MKKTLALILSALMLISMLSVTAFANPGDANNPKFVNFNTSPALTGDDARFDMTTGSLALRFVVQGNGKMKGFSFYTASWDVKDDHPVTFDFKLYAWQYNYEYTVAQEPVVALIGVNEVVSGYCDMLFDAPVDMGEYVAVMDNFQGGVVCNYRFTDNVYTTVYKDGVVQDGSIQWFALFTEEGGWYNGAELAAEVAAPAPVTTTGATTTEAPGTAGSSDNAGDSAETSDNALVATLAAVAVMGLAVACVAKKKQH